MKEKVLVLEIEGKDYQVVIKEFSAHTATISVNDNEYRIKLKDLGIDQVADIKPTRSRRYGEPQEDKTLPQKPVRSIVDKEPSRDALHRPASVVNTKSVLAPLPGLIQQIYVQVGDPVKTGQPVLKLEAMKMENEINATMDGVVTEIRCQEGASVNQGDVLILLDYAEE